MGKLIQIPNVIKTFGDSMYPLLLDGDILYLKKITFSKVKVNDIITVKNYKHYFTHRVIYKGRNYLITKGDNNPISDAKVYQKDIVGIVKNVKRNKSIFNPEQIYLLQSSLYFQEIVKIKKILEKEEIELVFLKGLPLHLYFEKTHPRRLYADCDILISKKDLLETLRILKQNGYKKAKHQTNIILSKNKKHLVSKLGEIAFFKIINSFPIYFDIHIEAVFISTRLGHLEKLYPRLLVEKLSEKLLREKNVVNINNELFPILSIENLFVYLLLHLFNHQYIGSYRYEFINYIIIKKYINYIKTIKILDEYRLKNFIYPGIIFLKKYYNSPIPLSFIKQIKPKGLSLHYANFILNKEIFDHEKTEGSAEKFKNIFFLSPYYLPKRFIIFLNPKVISTILWILYKRIKSFYNSLP